MSIRVQGFTDGLLEPDVSAPVQVPFVVETIGKPPAGEDNQRFEFTAEKRNIPRRPWSFGTEAKTARTDYSGTRNAPTEQVLSVKMGDFSLHGTLKDKFNFRGYAVEAWRGLEAITGRRVRCSYRSVYADGILTHADFDYQHEAEIGYTLTISPHNREPGQALKSSPRTVLNSTQLLSEVTGARDEVAIAHAAAPRFFVAGTLWTDLDDIISEWDATIATLENVISQRVLLPGTEPGTALKRIAATFRLVRSNAEAADDLMRAKRSDTDLTYAGASQILAFDVWSKGVLKGAKYLVVAAERASRELESRAEPNLIAVYSPKAGEHLMKIAGQFYGDPTNWKRIASRNNLGSSLVLTGEELLIIPEAVARQ